MESPSPSDDDDDEWGDVPSGLLGVGASSGSSGAAGGAARDFQLFAPEKVLELSESNGRPELPNLNVSDLPAGKTVWLADAEDIWLLSEGCFDSAVVPFTHGNVEATVVRHGSSATYVTFKKDDCIYGFTVPRSCLAISPIEPEETSFTTRKMFTNFSAAGSLGPKRARTGEVDPALLERLGRSPFERYLFQETVSALGEGEKFTYEIMYDLVRCNSDTEAEAKLVDVFPRSSTANYKTVWRTVGKLYRGDRTGALAEALVTLEAAPTSPIGYVSSAEVYIQLGRHQTAAKLLQQATFLKSHHSDSPLLLSSILLSQGCLQDIESQLAANGLGIVVDNSYVRRLVARKPFAPGDVIYEEHPSFWVPGVEDQNQRLCVCCQKALSPAEGIALPSENGNFPLEGWCCTQHCFDLARHNFAEYDTSESGARPVYCASYVVRDRYFAVRETSRIETAALAIRGFSHVMSTMRHPGSSMSLKDRVTAACRKMLLLPFPLLGQNAERNFDKKTVDDILTLFRLLSTNLLETEKEVITPEWFVLFFMSCEACRHSAAISLGDSSKNVSLHLLLPLLSACHRSVGRICQHPTVQGKWQLIAERQIEAQEVL